MPLSKMSLDGSAIAFVGNYLPRKCGIATFTHDLCEAVAQQAPRDTDVFAVAMNDKHAGYPYPPRVRFEVRENQRKDYRLAAEFLNTNQVSAVCLQHEYGIFGGTFGGHILSMLRRLRMPLVTTFHTILKHPFDEQRLILQEIARLSDRVVTMAEKGRVFLRDIYGVPDEKIVCIRHGIPDAPRGDSDALKARFGVEERKLLLTFGLLGPGKGIEHAIEAMPAVVAKHPDMTYIILGATHPNIVAESGEAYRNQLLRRINQLGLRDHVLFVNRFVEASELCEYLAAADIYITPYLNETQMTSGTLVYALGMGNAVVSTPYWHAEEALAGGIGKLVPFKDSSAMARAINELLDDPDALHAMQQRAYTETRPMVWPRTADTYLDLFNDAQRAYVKASPPTRRKEIFHLPEIDLRHFHTLTDDTGIFQHAKFTLPNREFGYCVDDNARALIVTGMFWDLYKDETILPLMQQALSFVHYAWNEETGRFRNFMSYDRRWMEDVGSEDSHGRTIWALGAAVALCPHRAMIQLASHLFLSALPVVEQFTSPRAWAFALCGVAAYLRRFGGDSEVRRFRATLTERLFAQFQKYAKPDWPWLEESLAYANAKLPHVLLMGGTRMQRPEMVDMGTRALRWLVDEQTHADGHFSLVGSNGGWHRTGSRARFDQQCIDAHALFGACIEAYHITRDEAWIADSRRAFNWFLGDNDIHMPLYDFTTGGCRDGLHPDRVNENQGAESTLAWLMSLLQMHEFEQELGLAEIPSATPPQKRPVHPPIGGL